MNYDEINRRTDDLYNAIAIATAFYGELDNEDRRTFESIVETTLSETDPQRVITGLVMLCVAVARDLSMVTKLPVPKQFQAAGAERKFGSCTALVTLLSSAVAVEAPPVHRFAGSALLHELLAAVDVVCCAGERRVGHQMDGQCGNVGGADYPPDGKSRAQFSAARVKAISEE